LTIVTKCDSPTHFILNPRAIGKRYGAAMDGEEAGRGIVTKKPHFRKMPVPDLEEFLEVQITVLRYH
jgi:hypothetical protein